MLTLRGRHLDAEMLKVAAAPERRALTQDFAGPSGATVVRAHSTAMMSQFGRQADALRFSFRSCRSMAQTFPLRVTTSCRSMAQTFPLRVTTSASRARQAATLATRISQ